VSTLRVGAKRVKAAYQILKQNLGITTEEKMKWQYEVLFLPISELNTAERILNNYGGSGWELVAVTDTQGTTPQFAYYFKRPAPTT
jgi:hypothetical protein